MPQNCKAGSGIPEPRMTKDSPYPIEDDNLYLIEMEEKHDANTTIVQGIHNASRQAYNILHRKWDQGYYPYDPENHAKCEEKYNNVKLSSQKQLEDLESSLRDYLSQGETEKVSMTKRIIKLLAKDYETEISNLEASLEQEGFNRNIYLLMHMPKEEAIRKTVRRGRVYSTIHELNLRSEFEYDHFSCSTIPISNPE